MKTQNREKGSLEKALFTTNRKTYGYEIFS